MHLGRVVPRAGELGEGQPVLPAVVMDQDVALFEVDVRGAVFTHRPKLHQVGIGSEVPHRPQDVQGGDDVVVLCEDGVLATDEGVRRGRHLAVMDDRLWLELPEQPLHEVPVAQVALGHADAVSGDLPPGIRPGRERVRDGGQGVGSGFLVRPPTQVVVDREHVVPAGREIHRGGPAQIAVTTQDQDPHRTPLFDRPGGPRAGLEASILYGLRPVRALRRGWSTMWRPHRWSASIGRSS